MQSFLLIAGGISVLAWLYLLLLHGAFWRAARLRAPSASASHVRVAEHQANVGAGNAGPVAAVIPARDEAESIDRAVRSLLTQTFAGAIHVFVVDDSSTDGTADAARQGASGDESRLTVIAGRPLQPGWTGKLWAAQQGIEEARKLKPRFLLLTDADIEHAPENVATLAGIAEREHYDLVSFMVKLHCGTVAEKLLIPAFVFFFFMLYPPAWIRSSRRQTAGAAGGCMLVRPEALERAGGMAAIRGQIIDDCALAARVKGSGGKVWLGLTQDTRSLRQYNTFAEIERMIARTAFNQLRHSVLILMGALLGLALAYLLPLTLLLSAVPRLAVLGAAGYLLMGLAYLPMVRFYGLSPAWALTLPAGAAFYMSATVHSALKYWTGRGGEWKGRAQDQIH
jgi:hopene-associated glycosyltransferase HpnB